MNDRINKKEYTSKFSDSYRKVGPYLGLGTQLAATIILMFFFGRWLDGQFNSEPFLMIIGSLLGGFAGIYNFIKTTLNLNKKKIDQKK